MECDFSRPCLALSWLGIYTEEKKNPTTFQICWLCVSPNTLAFTHIFFFSCSVVVLLFRALRSVKLISSEMLTIFYFNSQVKLKQCATQFQWLNSGCLLLYHQYQSFHFTCNLKDLLSSLCLIIICRIASNGNIIEFTCSETTNFIS